MMKPQCGKNLSLKMMRSGAIRILATVLGFDAPNQAPLGKTEEDLGDTLRALARRKPEGRPTAGHTEPSKQPLVLCGHGVLLRVEGGAFTIRNGFTHYPQKQETYRFFKGELSIHRALETAAFLSTCSHGSANKTCLSFALIGKAMCRAFWPTTAT
jgi:hypothetical protein